MLQVAVTALSLPPNGAAPPPKIRHLPLKRISGQIFFPVALHAQGLMLDT